MLDTPQITQTADTLTAVIRLTIPREEIRNVMGPGLRELMAAVAAQGIGSGKGPASPDNVGILIRGMGHVQEQNSDQQSTSPPSAKRHGEVEPSKGWTQ